MQADQALFLEGDRNPGWLPFTIEHTDNYSDHRHFGEPLAPNTLAGFNANLKESLFRTSAGGNHIGAVLVDRRRAAAWAELGSTAEISDRMEVNNTAILCPTDHHVLRQLMAPPPWRGIDAPHPIPGDLLEAKLIECLSPRSSTLVRPVRKTHHSDLVKELVHFFCHASADPISLSAVCKILFTTKTTLTVSCREMFGYGPMTLMRNIRLQQVHDVLSRPDLRQQLGFHSIQETAHHFGFTSRNHFASAYRKHFGQTPRQTMLNSR